MRTERAGAAYEEVMDTFFRKPSAASLLLAALLTIVVTSAMARVDEPAYRVVQSDGAIELRLYEPMLVAEVVRSGSRRAAINAGFRELASFIFGANLPRDKIAMTAPVIQAPAEGETIAMTAPVKQSRAAGGAWRVRFVMPAGYTLETLPRPISPDVRIIEEPRRTMAVIKFSGDPGEERLRDKTEALRAYIGAQGLAPKGDPVYAFYDPPWTLPFMRRNEVMIEVAR